MVSTEFKGVGLHYTGFRDAIREDSRQTTQSRGVSPRKKFAIEANVESRVNLHLVPHRGSKRMREDIRRGKHILKRRENLLPTAHVRQPIMQ